MKRWIGIALVLVGLVVVGAGTAKWGQVWIKESVADGDTYFVKLLAPNLSADVNQSLPLAAGTLIGTGDTGTVNGTMILDDTVALGTDTAGYYLAYVSAGLGLAVSGSAGEGWTATVGLDTTGAASGDYALSANEWKPVVSGIVFEGATADTLEGYLIAPDITGTDWTWTLPAGTYTLVGQGVGTINAGNTLSAGTPDTTQGQLLASGGAATDGGYMYLQNGATEDATYDSWRIGAEGAALWLGPDTDTDAFIFTVTGTLGMAGGLTSESGTVLAKGGLAAGVTDTTQGVLTLYSGATTVGAKATLENAPDEDTTYQSYTIEANGDYLWIGSDVDPDAMSLSGAGALTLAGSITTTQGVVTSTAPHLWLAETDTTNLDGRIQVEAGIFKVLKVSDANAGLATPLQIDLSTNAVTLTGAVTAASDTDSTHVFGRAKIGYGGGTDTASFAHTDMGGAVGNLALWQNATGYTVINCATGAPNVSIRENNTIIATFDAASITFAQNLAITSGNASLGSSDTTQGYVTLRGDSNLAGGLAYFYNGANEDTTYDFWQAAAQGAEFHLGPDTDTDAYKFGATGTLTLTAGGIDTVGSIETEGSLTAFGGGLIVGTNSTNRAAVLLWDGSGGNTPAYIAMGSPNGTIWYLFVEDDGTVKVHNASPTQNADGTVIGSQT